MQDLTCKKYKPTFLLMFVTHKDMCYPINYGYVTGIKGGDVIIPSDDEIYAQIAFQEQFFSGVLVRRS